MDKRVITGTSKICALIGDPVAHSLSPLIQNVAFKECGLDYFYCAFPVKTNALKDVFAGVRALGIKGINITIPHKVNAMQYLDEIDTAAASIGAVNTVVNHNGYLTGYNTDAAGFLQPLIEKGISVKDKKVTLLGAGGAARAVAYILAEQGANVVIVNRTISRAEECAAKIRLCLNKKVAVLPLTQDNLRSTLADSDILVNTTSIGMRPHNAESPVDGSFLHDKLVVYDIVYQPVKTLLLQLAEQAGATTITGSEMLAWQGALAFEKWTNVKAPVQLMLKTLRTVLEHRD